MNTFASTQVHKNLSPANLIDIVGAGLDPSNNNPVPIRVEMEDGKVITGSYYRSHDRMGSNADIYYPKGNPIMDDELIRPYVEELLNTGKDFVVCAGGHDEVLTIIWELQVD